MSDLLCHVVFATQADCHGQLRFVILSSVKPKPLVLLLLVATAVAALAVSLARRPAASHAVSGTIETDAVHIASRHGGRVVQLFASEGERLQAGQPVIALEAPELRARRDQIAALLQELESGPRPEEIAAVRAEWEALTAQRDLARLEEKRTRELFDQQVATSAERDQAASRLAALDKSVAAAKARYDLLLAGTRAERLAHGRAQLAEMDAQLREMTVTAPLAGKAQPSSQTPPSPQETSPADYVLEVLNVKVGDVVPANREVATLLLADRLWVRVYVPAPWLARIQLGQPVKVRVDGSREEFTGTVEQINRQAEFTPRNVQTVEDRVRQVFGVKVRLPGDTHVLKPGMAVDVYF